MSSCMHLSGFGERGSPRKVFPRKLPHQPSYLEGRQRAEDLGRREPRPVDQAVDMDRLIT